MFRRLVRTTAFKLSVAYLAMFSVIAGALIWYLGATTTALIEGQINQSIEDEIQELDEAYRFGGMPRLISLVNFRSQTPGAGLYLITDFSGNPVAGNVGWVDDSVLAVADGVARQAAYTRFGERAQEIVSRHALVRVFELPVGFRILVGRDTGEQTILENAINNATRVFVIGVVSLAVLSWLLVGRRALRRVDKVAAASTRIADGDLQQRLPIDGSNDEFDRLSVSLNAIMDRLASLNMGLKDVSENIAHDLKTPLTRVRNKLEELTLAKIGDEERQRKVTDLIGECDQIIRVFESLLMIARMQSGTANVSMDSVDLSSVVRDVADLYEPAVQDAGASFTLEVENDLSVFGNRELLGQAIANLIENATKYGLTGKADDGPELRLEAKSQGTRLSVLISDNGPGIPEAERERVKERFVRLDVSRGETSGTGLGLSLVDAVATLHGGSLTLSNANPGLIACLKLPRSA